jgi:hypothetical protein
MKAVSVLLAVVGSAASAQLAPINVSPQIRASPVEEIWAECSIAVRTDTKFEVLVMASGSGLDTNNDPVAFLGYSTINFASIVPSIVSNRLGEGCGGGDVWVTAEPGSGRIWFAALQGYSDTGGGGQNGDPNDPPENIAAFEDDEIDEQQWPGGPCAGGLIVGWKNPGSTTITNVYTHSSGFQDKPALAIGGDQVVTHYLLRQKKLGNCSGQQHEADSSITPMTGPGSWTDYTLEAGPSQNGCHYEGWGVAPVVLDASTFSDGRVVAAIRDHKPQIGGKYNNNLPYVVFSDDGIDWEPDPDINGDVEPILLGDSTIEATTTKGTSTDPGDTPWHVNRRNHAPSVAVKYIEGIDDEVYVAFCAREAPSSTNTDLYISRSEESQTSDIDFPFNPSHFFHVTDTFLGTTTGTDGADQFVPAIAIDSCGGVNLMFYDNRNDPDRTDSIELVDVYYARIANYGTGSETVTQHRLTPQSFRVDNLGGNRFLGDYHNLTVSPSGRTIYAAYISRDNADPVDGGRTCYVHKINIICSGGPLAEMNGDGSLTGDDAVAFTTAWAAGDPEADTNLDMAVNADDLVDYLLTYSEESE